MAADKPVALGARLVRLRSAFTHNAAWCPSRTLQALCQRLEQQSDGAPKQLPFDRIQYLLEHLDRYMVHL